MYLMVTSALGIYHESILLSIEDTLYCNISLTIKHKFNDPLISLFDIITITVFMLIEG